ncbi:hypothetical protein GCM10018773_08200 [Streptomyces candidus]|nr:hypothetical protein GCM10018773_08200 [Streptomyces candidus]
MPSRQWPGGGAGTRPTGGVSEPAPRRESRAPGRGDRPPGGTAPPPDEVTAHPDDAAPPETPRTGPVRPTEPRLGDGTPARRALGKWTHRPARPREVNAPSGATRRVTPTLRHLGTWRPPGRPRRTAPARHGLLVLRAGSASSGGYSPAAALAMSAAKVETSVYTPG